jgi:hypothetical protein
MIGEADAIEDVLARRQIFDQRLRGEVGFRQGIDESAAADRCKAVAGGDLDKHARGPVGTRPHNSGIGRDIAGLDAVGEDRTIHRAAERRLSDGAGDRTRRGRTQQEPASRQQRAGARSDGHWASAVEST